MIYIRIRNSDEMLIKRDYIIVKFPPKPPPKLNNRTTATRNRHRKISHIKNHFQLTIPKLVLHKKINTNASAVNLSINIKQLGAYEKDQS